MLNLEYHQKNDQFIMKLEKISDMIRNEAKDELFSKLKEKLLLEFNKIIKNHEYNIKFQSKEFIATNIVSEAIEPLCK